MVTRMSPSTEEVTTATALVGAPNSHQQNISATAAPYFYSGLANSRSMRRLCRTGPDAKPGDVPVLGGCQSVWQPHHYAGSVSRPAIDAAYETEQQYRRANNDGTIAGGAAVFTPVFSPTIPVRTSTLDFSFTLETKGNKTWIRTSATGSYFLEWTVAAVAGEF